jgi:hypothetical protein
MKKPEGAGGIIAIWLDPAVAKGGKIVSSDQLPTALKGQSNPVTENMLADYNRIVKVFSDNGLKLNNGKKQKKGEIRFDVWVAPMKASFQGGTATGSKTKRERRHQVIYRIPTV